MVGGNAVFIADDPPAADQFRVPGYLGAGLVGKGRSQSQPVVPLKNGAGLGRVVQIAIPAVAVLGQLLEQVVVVVGNADADGDEAQGVVGPVIGGGFQDGKGVGGVHISHAIGHQDDVVPGVGAFLPHLIRKLDALVEAGLDIGSGVGLQGGDGFGRPIAGVAGVYGPVMQDVVGEVDDGDAVLRAEALVDGSGGGPGDVHPVALAHRPGGVQYQGYIQRPVVGGQRRGLESQARQVFAVIQRMGDKVGGDGEFVRPAGVLIAVGKGVNPLLGAHRIGFDGKAGPGPIQGEAVGSAVGVEAEGGNRVLPSID